MFVNTVGHLLRYGCGIAYLFVCETFAYANMENAVVQERHLQNTPSVIIFTCNISDIAFKKNA